MSDGMIVTNSFVFTHLPKTGGTFVKERLEQFAENVAGFKVHDLERNRAFRFFFKEPILRKHPEIQCIPNKFRGLPAVLNIRNVFEHYPKSISVEQVNTKYPNSPDLAFSEFLRCLNQWKYRKNIQPYFRRRLSESQLGLNLWNLIRFIKQSSIRFVRKLGQMIDDEVRDSFGQFWFLRTEC